MNDVLYIHEYYMYPFMAIRVRKPILFLAIPYSMSST